MTSIAELQDYAGSAKFLLMTLPDIIDALDIPEKDSVGLSTCLVRSSIDIGIGALSLLEQDASGGGMAAMVLVRPQLDHLFRAIWLGTAADAAFSEKYVSKRDAKFPSFQEMSAHAADVLSKTPLGEKQKGWDVLPRMVKFAKGRLNGYVHGGVEAAAPYVKSGEGRFLVELPVMTEAVMNLACAGIFGLAFTQSLATPSDRGKREHVDVFVGAYRRWTSHPMSTGLGVRA